MMMINDVLQQKEIEFFIMIRFSIFLDSIESKHRHELENQEVKILFHLRLKRTK